MTTTEEKEALVTRLEAARRQLRTALQGLDIHTEVYPGWEVKHLLAHIAGWDEACTSSLRAHAGGREPATPAMYGIDPFNEVSVETRKDLPYDRIHAEFEESRRQFIAAIRELPEERFTQPMIVPWGPKGTVTSLVAIFEHHEIEHATEMEKIKSERK